MAKSPPVGFWHHQISERGPMSGRNWGRPKGEQIGKKAAKLKDWEERRGQYWCGNRWGRKCAAAFGPGWFPDIFKNNILALAKGKDCFSDNMAIAIILTHNYLIQKPVSSSKQPRNKFATNFASNFLNFLWRTFRHSKCSLFNAVFNGPIPAIHLFTNCLPKYAR
jgi:hypothetical protein